MRITIETGLDDEEQPVPIVHFPYEALDPPGPDQCDDDAEHEAAFTRSCAEWLAGPNDLDTTGFPSRIAALLCECSPELSRIGLTHVCAMLQARPADARSESRRIRSLAREHGFRRGYDSILMRRICDWICASDEPGGVQCRSIIFAWIFCRRLRQFTLTEISERFGKHKQSLGRFITSLLTRFPALSHIQHIRQHEHDI